jgi:hypothetical protein
MAMNCICLTRHSMLYFAMMAALWSRIDRSKFVSLAHMVGIKVP